MHFIVLFIWIWSRGKSQQHILNTNIVVHTNHITSSSQSSESDVQNNIAGICLAQLVLATTSAQLRLLRLQAPFLNPIHHRRIIAETLFFVIVEIPRPSPIHTHIPVPIVSLPKTYKSHGFRANLLRHCRPNTYQQLCLLLKPPVSLPNWSNLFFLLSGVRYSPSKTEEHS